MAVNWNEKFRFGHPELDDERRRLFELTNYFASRKNLEAARAVVARLRKYANESFRREEQLMVAAGYKDAAVHAGHHRVLAKHVNDLLLAELPSAGAKPNADFVVKVATVLEMWIFNHFMTQDPKLQTAMGRFGEGAGRLHMAAARAAAR